MTGGDAYFGGASGGTRIGGGGAFVTIGIGNDGAAASALRAAEPHVVAGGAWPDFVNVVGNDEIARGLANGMTSLLRVSGAAITAAITGARR